MADTQQSQPTQGKELKYQWIAESNLHIWKYPSGVIFCASEGPPDRTQSLCYPLAQAYTQGTPAPVQSPAPVIAVPTPSPTVIASVPTPTPAPVVAGNVSNSGDVLTFLMILVSLIGMVGSATAMSYRIAPPPSQRPAAPPALEPHSPERQGLEVSHVTHTLPHDEECDRSAGTVQVREPDNDDEGITQQSQGLQGKRDVTTISITELKELFDPGSVDWSRLLEVSTRNQAMSQIFRWKSEHGLNHIEKLVYLVFGINKGGSQGEKRRETYDYLATFTKSVLAFIDANGRLPISTKELPF